MWEEVFSTRFGGQNEANQCKANVVKNVVEIAKQTTAVWAGIILHSTTSVNLSPQRKTQDIIALLEFLKIDLHLNTPYNSPCKFRECRKTLLLSFLFFIIGLLCRYFKISRTVLLTLSIDLSIIIEKMNFVEKRRPTDHHDQQGARSFSSILNCSEASLGYRPPALDFFFVFLPPHTILCSPFPFFFFFNCSPAVFSASFFVLFLASPRAPSFWAPSPPPFFF